MDDQEEMFLDRLFNQVEDVVTGISDEPKEIDYDTSWLFGNMQDMYFEEDIIDHNEIENMVLHKKQNKLFSIFLKQQTLAPTPKRKLSPQEQTINKMRRMTINSDTSPALRTPRRRIQITGVQGSRSLSRSVRTRQTSNDKGKKEKQTLISRFYMASKVSDHDVSDDFSSTK